MVPPRPPQQPSRLPKSSAISVRGEHAFGQSMAVAAMRRGDPVDLAQMRADADGGRLLADIKMQEAGRLALAAGGLRRAFETPQQHHLS